MLLRHCEKLPMFKKKSNDGAKHRVLKGVARDLNTLFAASRNKTCKC